MHANGLYRIEGASRFAAVPCFCMVAIEESVLQSRRFFQDIKCNGGKCEAPRRLD
jgi:hypothetical protein